jgi:hypothetical protein
MEEAGEAEAEGEQRRALCRPLRPVGQLPRQLRPPLLSHRPLPPRRPAAVPPAVAVAVVAAVVAEEADRRRARGRPLTTLTLPQMISCRSWTRLSRSTQMQKQTPPPLPLPLPLHRLRRRPW